MNFENKIMPFFWTEHEEMASVCLNVGEYCKDVFEIRASEGFLGNGYDWESLATVFLEEKMPNLIGYSRSEAIYLMKTLGYDYEIEGYGYVTNQSVEAGKNVNGKVIIKLESKEEKKE